MKKILFISGSIGLGHVFRDLAIVREMRRRRPGLEISWIACPPASRIIHEAGERLLPEADLWANANIAAEKASSTKPFEMNVLRFVMASGSEWKNNVAVFRRVTTRERFDLIIGDETYEIGAALKKHPEIKTAPFMIIYDFIGLEAMTANPLERLGVYMWNRIWSKGFKRASKTIDAVLFVGEPEDIPDNRMGFLLPNRRVWAEYRKVSYVGYILPFSVSEFADQVSCRKSLGYGAAPLVIAAIGGTGIGKDLLELCGRAFLLAKEEIPDLRLMLVCGPRLDPNSIVAPEGVEVRGYVPDLYKHFAACDLAIVQGGGAVTLELTALRRPFLYFPLEGHCEQMNHVAERLSRHGAGIPLLFSRTTPDALARQITANVGREATWPVVAVDGAEKSAEIICRFL
jgi:UDP:flavonoid glycosyltransferase YjiC (YdhE family)